MIGGESTLGTNHSVASQTSSTRRRRRVIPLKWLVCMKAGTSGVDKHAVELIVLTAGVWRPTGIRRYSSVFISWVSLPATQGETRLETTGAACTICGTMRKIALLLIVLLGVSHFATVSRCEDGKWVYDQNVSSDLACWRNIIEEKFSFYLSCKAKTALVALC